MVGKIGARSTARPNDFDVKLRFGGGLNTRASIDEINEREATDGENFILDFRDTQFRPREQFDLVGTAPNGAEIRGFAQLLKADGTISTLVQAETAVYETDFTTWYQVGTVDAQCKLRGPRHHIWELDDKLLITDMSLLSPVLEWDGSTLSEVAHNLAGTFLAKYCYVTNERATFANVISNSVSTPHVLVGSKRGDYANLSTSSRPSSALSEEDPWFLISPDLKAFNGLMGAFGLVALSSKKGQMWKLTGDSAKDFAIEGLHPDSAADGDESIAYVGNDIVYGRQGRLESLLATDTFGDVETNDISRDISNRVNGFGGWRIAYNSRLQRIYFHPSGEEQLWVFFKPIAELDISPWSKFTTAHAMAFNPTAMMTMFDPDDGLEYTFLGDQNGRVYRLEGTGTGGDGGSVDITAFRTSRLVSAPGMADAYDIEGFVKYRKGEESALDLTVLWQGEAVYDIVKNLTLTGIGDRPVYGGDNYYGDGTVYGSLFEGKLVRERFGVEGQSQDFQVKLSITGSTPFEITETQLGFSASG